MFDDGFDAMSGRRHGSTGKFPVVKFAGQAFENSRRRDEVDGSAVCVQHRSDRCCVQSGTAQQSQHLLVVGRPEHGLVGFGELGREQLGEPLTVEGVAVGELVTARLMFTEPPWVIVLVARTIVG